MPNRSSNKHGAMPPAIVALIALMNELVEVMSAEPELVMSRKFADHKELLRRKQKLTLEYRASLKSVFAQPDMLKALPEDVRRKLKSAAQKLADTADRNARSLRTAVTTVQRLIQNIVAHVKREALFNPGYKNPKTAHLQLGTYSPTCKPVAVRQSV
ncbi:MAG: hypothetical protein AB7H77_06405 [Bdellovibrionales bacterium]